MDVADDERQCRVWVEGDRVYAQTVGGRVTAMTAEVALRMSRLLGLAGGAAIMNRMGSPDDLREGPIETP
ncbi:MAG: hypothetical protein PGN09_13435 [Sphingomonas fennica]